MKLRKSLLVILALSMALLPGCSNKAVEKQVIQDQEVQQPVASTDIKESNENADKIAEVQPAIVLNQLGYLPNAAKKVIFRIGSVGDTFDVVDVGTNEVAYTGEIEEEVYSAIDEQPCFVANFSELTKPGQYKIVSEKYGTSYPFNIGEDVYKEVFKEAVRFYYYQRCGQELTKEYAGEWAHPTCHSEMATIYGTDKKIDVSGGWHDAGDYGRYVVATAKAAADLMLAYEANPEAFTDDFNIPESGNGVPDVLDEVKYQLQWLLKMQDQTSGGVYHKVTCADFPDIDVMPQDETDELIVCPISTTATGDFVAVMSMGSELYQDIDKDLANQCLEAAKLGWEYLKKAPASAVDNPEGIVTGAYKDTMDKDERFWAAVQLFKATGEEQYHEEIKAMMDTFTNEQNPIVGYGWQTVASYGLDSYLACKNTDPEARKAAETFQIEYAEYCMENMIKGDAYEITTNRYDFYWGSNMVILSVANVLEVADELMQSNNFHEYAVERVNYCFGKNPLGMSFVTGFGTVYPKYPHHRPSVATGKTIPGMIIGGANMNLEDDVALDKLYGKPAAQCYIDDYQSYSTNEVDIYWNSSLVYALAKLRLV